MTRSPHPSASRRKLLLLAALFVLPVLVAYALYYSGWRPETVHPHGELVQPARPVADTALVLLDGKPLRFSELHGKWTLVTFSAAECLKPCERNLSKMRQVIAAQGKDSERVQSVLVVTDGKALDWMRNAIQDYPGMRIVTGPAAAVAALAREFALPAGNRLDTSDRVYLVDPLGNLMMSYPADADPTGMRKDLGHLLRISQIG
jgi:cytochrome oxidase Cu insertion factor (SCO1/SenC/PrrC family)